MRQGYKNIIENAIKASKNEENHFIVDVIAEIGISNVTFYKYIPNKSEAYKEIMENIIKNRVRTKKEMRKNWKTNGHPTLQVSLMKLIGTDEERKALSRSHIDIESGGEKIQHAFDISKLSTDTLLELSKLYEQQNETKEEND